MQKSFDTMTQQMNNGLNLNDLLNMPNVSMINLGSIQDAIPRPKKVKKKKEDARPLFICWVMVSKLFCIQSLQI